MNEEIQKALLDLEASLNSLDDAADIIKKSEEASFELIKNVSDLITNVKAQLDSFKTSMDKWASVLKLDSEKILSNYRDVSKNHEKIINEFLDNYNQLASETNKLVKYLNSVNFPARLDKIDSTIASISNGFQILQTQIADTKRELNKELDELVKKVDVVSNAIQMIDNKLDKISEKNEEHFRNFNQNFEKYKKINKLTNIALIILIIISIIASFSPIFS
jgi:ABC-type transporter Mla subunit MlaD